MDLVEGETDFEETEALDVRRLPFQEAIAMLEQGDITDAISVAALLRVEKLLLSRSLSP